MDLFVTMFYCVVDPTTGVLRYANGSHPPPYLRRADESVEALNGAGGLVLGAMPDGVFLVRQVMVAVSHQRVGARNQLRMTKHVNRFSGNRLPA